MLTEQERIKDFQWRKWGAYVSERAWGTVREDYSENGDAWNFLTHDMARSKAYRWGEDGLCGWCDLYQTLVFSLSLWNGKDPILKERLFGLNPFEGNHGEDVKEYYFYQDATPTHSYMKFLYRYPHNAFPYDELVKENQRRGVREREFELIDTGVFANNAFFDIVVEYAKASPDDVCIRIEIFNRGEREASIHVLPQLWFRNRWAWEKKWDCVPEISSRDGCLYADPKKMPEPDWLISDYSIFPYYLIGDKAEELLFTNNETHNERLYGTASHFPYVKDAFHRYVIHQENCVNPAKKGTKACFHYKLGIPAKQSRVLKLRLSQQISKLEDVDGVVAARKIEADAFYGAMQPKGLSPEDKQIQRQALAGLIWSTQFYFYDVQKWLEGDDKAAPPSPSRYQIRNTHWVHLHCHNLIVMPDKWEYPWFASWDSCFHITALSLVDLPFAKWQMKLFLTYKYQHPNGQVPAYEWGFSEANPPVQAFAVWQLYEREKDPDFLEFCFIKLLSNFSWWINKVDRFGNNVFEGGFLGLDNISVFDRSKPLRSGGYFEESDGTGWMGFFALLMMKMALELACIKPYFEQFAMVFLEHYVAIAGAMQGTRNRPMDFWDEQDGFFYDLLCHPDGTHFHLKVRSFVGLIPFYSLESFDEEELKKHPRFYGRFQNYLKHFNQLVGRCITRLDGRYIFSLMTLDQMKRVLQKVWDPNEFLSAYGLRSVSKFHEKHPFSFHGNVVGYEPGESIEKIKGGNSNWRGPIWFPVNYLFLRSLIQLSKIAGPDFGMDLSEMASDLRQRLINLFRKDSKGLRPIFYDCPGLSGLEGWNDLLLFFEHYHGDTGRGLGASHQTGWSALVANLIQQLNDSAGR